MVIVSLRRQGVVKRLLASWFCYDFELFETNGVWWTGIVSGRLRGAKSHRYDPRHTKRGVISGKPRICVPDRLYRGSLWFQRTVTGTFEQVLEQLEGVFGNRFKFDRTGVEAYMFYPESLLQLYPSLRSDYFLAYAYYDQATETIRQVRTGRCLVSFDGEFPTPYDTPPNDDKQSLLADCIKEYMQADHRKITANDAKGWLAYLISERLRALPHQHPTRLASLVRESPLLSLEKS